MKAPGFWTRGEGGMAAALLAPAAWAYGTGAAIRDCFATAPWRAGVPVVCAGNVTVGGGGKTPTAIAIAERLGARGRKPHFLTRGYGGRLSGPSRVEPDRHGAADVGDEALLLAARAPTWMGADRAATARLAIAAGADVLVMDDGLQNNTLARDLGLLVVDGGFGLGNGRLLPAGPLREPLTRAVRRVGAVVIIGDDETDLRQQLSGELSADIPVLAAVVEPDAAAELAGVRVLAFAGIARPEKFFATLAAIGADIAERVEFADHHRYAAAEIAELTRRAAGLGARLVTTEKDWVRLDADTRANVAQLPIRLRWQDDAALDALIDGLLDGHIGGGDAG